MSVYVPQNLDVFIAAFAGALSGMNADRWNTDSTAIDYAKLTAAAGAYAQEFDTTWGAVIPDNFQLETIQEISEATWERRSGLTASSTNADYAQIVNALIAIINEGEAYLASIGIIPISEEGAFVDIREFGAKGNNTTDDTAAWQAAVNALAGTGRTIWESVPP